MKPSHLRLDPDTMQQGGLVNPKAIMQEFHQASYPQGASPSALHILQLWRFALVATMALVPCFELDL